MNIQLYLYFTLAFLTRLNVNGGHLSDYQCTYHTEGGHIDLSSLVNQNGSARFSVQDIYTLFEYFWNPCYPFNIDNVCQDAGLCQLIGRLTNFYVMMAHQDGELEKDQHGNPVLYYIGTDPQDHTTRKTYISLICDVTGTDLFTFNGESPISEYHFSLTSKHACIIPDQPTTAPPTPGPSPGPTPPIFSLATITILLAGILILLCVLNCMVFLGLITRSTKQKQRNQLSYKPGL